MTTLHFPEAEGLVEHYSWRPSIDKKGVVILRGLPGSGKTTFARQIVEAAANRGIRACICSADDYFMDSEGCYRFEARRLATAHDVCKAKFDTMLCSNVGTDPFATSIIIVDNTNIVDREYSYYVERALQYDLLYVYRFDCCDLEEAFKQASRSVHDIPWDTVRRRYSLYQQNEYDISIQAIYTRPP